MKSETSPAPTDDRAPPSSAKDNATLPGGASATTTTIAAATTTTAASSTSQRAQQPQPAYIVSDPSAVSALFHKVSDHDRYRLLRTHELNAYRLTLRTMLMHAAAATAAAAAAGSKAASSNVSSSSPVYSLTRQQQRTLEDMRESWCISEARHAIELEAARSDPRIAQVRASGVSARREPFFDGVNDVPLPDVPLEGTEAPDGRALVTVPPPTTRGATGASTSAGTRKPTHHHSSGGAKKDQGTAARGATASGATGGSSAATAAAVHNTTTVTQGLSHVAATASATGPLEAELSGKYDAIRDRIEVLAKRMQKSRSEQERVQVKLQLSREKEELSELEERINKEL